MGSSMRRFFKFFLLPVLVLLVAGYFGGTYIYKNRLYAPVSNMLSDETKQWLRETVLIFQYKDDLERAVAEKQRIIDLLWEAQDAYDEAVLANPGLPDSLGFSRITDEVMAAGDDVFHLVRYETPSIPLHY